MGNKDIAIIGMACMYPGAFDLKTFWQNIIAKVDSVRDVPPDRWDPELFYDPDPAVEDKVYCKQGGYLDGKIPFNPLRYGVMPVAVEGGEPDQFLVLRVAYDAMEDAGYLDREIDGERAEFIMGRGNYLGAGLTNLIQRGQITEQTLQILKALHPEYSEAELEEIRREMRAPLPGFQSETAPAIIPNITTGRVANRLGFMGPNFTIDAACASSLLAVDLAVRDLRSEKVDLALAGGVHIFTNVPFLMVFGALKALSPTSQIRPYDEQADGTMPGEGVGIVVLKRLEDAEHDGDRIYAVIKGTGTSSDGRAVSVTAPRVEGEELALRRAYSDAGLLPQTIGLIEGHGTGTPAGDAAELETISRVFTDAKRSWRWCALGTIKSMIGHAMPAAGAAGLIKTALALYHKVLPPTLHCESLNPLLTEAPIYVNTETRPWIHGLKTSPRRAGINAFGFGGANAHVILEEYEGAEDLETHTYLQDWETELLLIQGETRQALVERMRDVQEYIQNAIQTESPSIQNLLRDLAYSLNTQPQQAYRLAIVASSIEDLGAKLIRSLERLSDPECLQIKDTQGIYYFEQPLAGKLAFLFPGEGAQYLNMLSELCVHFPEVRACFDTADQVFDGEDQSPPTYDIFPPPFFSEEAREKAEARLWQIDRATTAVLTADGAIYTLFKNLQLRPDMMVGHSAGEWIAMAAAGIFDTDEFTQSMNRLDRIYHQVVGDATIPQAIMVAAGTDRDTVISLAERIDGEIYIANDNCPHQVVIVGEESLMQEMLIILRQQNIMFEQLPYQRGYHTPVFTYMCEPLREYFSSLEFSVPQISLYSCTTVDLYPEDTEEILNMASQTFARPLEFRKTIERMYDDGARIFVEIGPKGNLTSFVDDILRGRPHLALASDVQRRSGISQLNHVLGLLSAQKMSINLAHLYARREPKKLTLDISQDIPVQDNVGVMLLPLGYPIMSVSARPEAEERRRISRVSGSTATQKTMVSQEQSMATEDQQLHTPPTSPQPSVSAYVETTRTSEPSPPEVSAEASKATATSQTQYAAALGISGQSSALTQKAMQDHLLTMEHFLEVQEDIMRAYLGGSDVPSTDVQDTMNWPTNPLHEEAEPISSIGRTVTETLSAASEPSPIHASPTIEPADEPKDLTGTSEPLAGTTTVPRAESSSGTTASRPSPKEILLSVVSEKTGYPTEMLGLDLDMEADLGIDSIKRIEILGSLQEQYSDVSQGDMDVEKIASLKTLQEVIDLLSTTVGQNDDASELSASAATEPYPFVGEITSFIPDQELTSIRRFEWDEDIFIHDHTFGQELSHTEPLLRPLPVVPMTISIEAMAEAAALLCPGKKLLRIEQVKARQWIYMEIEECHVDTGIKAVATGNDRVHAKIYNPESPDETTFIEGDFVFGDALPEPPRANELILTNGRPPKHTARQLYDDHLMFHGPRFQGVSALDQVGEDGLLAQLEVLPTDNLFRSNPNPKLLLDPFLFDAAGQLVGYWPVEYLNEGYVLFPIQVEELQLFSDTPQAGTRLTCQLRHRKLTKQQFAADMDIVLPDGRVWMRIIGWGDWRFYWSDDFYNFWRFPNKGFMSQHVALPDSLHHLECRLIKPFGYIENEMWEVLWAHLILNATERETYRGMQAGKRRTEWLFGRAAAKDAVRSWLKHVNSVDWFPADVEIRNDELGCPNPFGAWMQAIEQVPRLSIAHTHKVAIAVAGDTAFIGVDIESVGSRSGNMERYVFVESERVLLQRIEEEHRAEWMMRFWCAKEAVAKAVGHGMIEGAHSAIVQQFDVNSGSLRVMLGQKLAEVTPDLAGMPIKVHTVREDNYVIAVTVGERS